MSTDTTTQSNGAHVPAVRPSVPTASNPTAGGTTPAGGGGLPPLDPADTRFADARQYLARHAMEAQVIADGLSANEVDQVTLAAISDKRDADKALIQAINAMYAEVEEAVNSAQHVAKKKAYEQR
jgi:hypothetical protein